MGKLMDKGPIVGTHTFDDAFLYIRNHNITKTNISIIDLLPTIFEMFEINKPVDSDGTSVLENSN